MTQVEAITVTGEWLFYVNGQPVKREKNLIVQSGLNEKKAKGNLTLEDVDEKLDVIIEILQDLMPPK